ncbi:MAG: uncharacterized protein A8A55_1146 [Amphiamblys sp. WSBS2006]|nr:MAG: uncharacterized protein A8A55_1146 [Amphiamblys sp. WSBS2006]
MAGKTLATTRNGAHGKGLAKVSVLFGMFLWGIRGVVCWNEDGPEVTEESLEIPDKNIIRRGGPVFNPKEDRFETIWDELLNSHEQEESKRAGYASKNALRSWMSKIFEHAVSEKPLGKEYLRMDAFRDRDFDIMWDSLDAVSEGKEYVSKKVFQNWVSVVLDQEGGPEKPLGTEDYHRKDASRTLEDHLYLEESEEE